MVHAPDSPVLVLHFLLPGFFAPPPLPLCSHKCSSPRPLRCTRPIHQSLCSTSCCQVSSPRLPVSLVSSPVPRSPTPLARSPFLGAFHHELLVTGHELELGRSLPDPLEPLPDRAHDPALLLSPPVTASPSSQPAASSSPGPHRRLPQVCDGTSEEAAARLGCARREGSWWCKKVAESNPGRGVGVGVGGGKRERAVR